jgi:hypothetical protein
MKAMLMAGFGMLAGMGMAAAQQPKPAAGDAQAQPAPLFQLQRRPTPDTSMPGSTGPGAPMVSRRNDNRIEQYYAAELRRCETLGDVTRRLACKDSVRDKFGEM